MGERKWLQRELQRRGSGGRGPAAMTVGLAGLVAVIAVPILGDPSGWGRVG